MEIFQNYNNYKVYEPDYAEWKAKRNLYNAKKKDYLEKNPVSEEEKQSAAKRGKVLLRALDVMDEYSQIRAQDAETVTEQITGQIMGVAMSIGMLAGTFLMVALNKGKFTKTKIEKLEDDKIEYFSKDMIIPYAVGIGASILASIPLMATAAKIQIGASRHGRLEAMDKDLSNPNEFAVLDENQEKQVNEIAKTIPVDKEMKKQLQNRDMDMNPFGFMDSINELLGKNGLYDEKEEEFEAKIEANQAKAGQNLTEKDILTAKKDQKLLLNMVEKVDIASQDYSENVEFATNTFSFASSFASIGLGWLTGKALELAKVKSSIAKAVAPWGVAFIGATVVSSYMTGLQKQASRVGRFKVKQEMEKDVNNFIYVDDAKLDAHPDVAVEDKPKPNIFEFLSQVIKDNKEYKQYLKTEAIEEKKRQRALQKITLTEDQLADAKALQFKTFKTFNRVDDNSQKYSESVEAVGQIVQNPVALVGTLGGMAIGGLIASKKANKMLKENKVTKENSVAMGLNAAIPIVLGIFVGAIPAVIFDYFITKEQKKASRIADMLAIKELDDYKEFVDYENLSQSKETAKA